MDIAALLQDAHFWVGVAFAIFAIAMIFLGVPKILLKALDAKAIAVQAQLDEATQIRQEAEALLAQIKTQSTEAEKTSAEILATARSEAKRLEAEATVKLAEQIKRRGELAERKIATAEAQAASEVKSAAADLAAQLAENVLAARVKGLKSDPLVDSAIKDMGAKLQ